MNIKQTVAVEPEQEYRDSASTRYASLVVTPSESPIEKVPTDQAWHHNSLVELMEAIADDIFKEIGAGRVTNITITPWNHILSVEDIPISKALSITIVLAPGVSAQLEEYRRICTLVKKRAPVDLQNGECLKGCYRFFFSPRSNLWFISRGFPPID